MKTNIYMDTRHENLVEKISEADGKVKFCPQGGGFEYRVSSSVWFYPSRGEDALHGRALRAPAGLPVQVVDTRKARVLVQSAAPEGWGEWSGRAMFAWVEKAAVTKEAT